jgi:NAD(P)-dependent dehydrogenase (short-subunit alcohol dehydrogenase family)
MSLGRISFSINHDVKKEARCSPTSIHRSYRSIRSAMNKSRRGDRAASTSRPPSKMLEVDPPLHTRTRTVMSKILSPMVMKRFGTTGEQVAAILFLASEDTSYITGVTLPMAGGDLG